MSRSCLLIPTYQSSRRSVDSKSLSFRSGEVSLNSTLVYLLVSGDCFSSRNTKNILNTSEYAGLGAAPRRDARVDAGSHRADTADTAPGSHDGRPRAGDRVPLHDGQAEGRPWAARHPHPAGEEDRASLRRLRECDGSKSLARSELCSRPLRSPAIPPKR